MKVRYMGTYNMDLESLPNKEEREGATKFREASADKLSKMITYFSLFLLLTLYLALIIKIKFNLMGLCIGAASSVLILFPHEYLHAVCFREECYLYSNVKNGMIFVVGNEDMSKFRFIFMTLFPNFIFGLIPYTTAFLLYKYGIMSYTCYILGGFGATALVAGAGDFYNAYIALIQMPWGAKTYLHKFDSYWYYPEEKQEIEEPVEEAVVQEASEQVGEEVEVQEVSEQVGEEVEVQEVSGPMEKEVEVQEVSGPVEKEVEVQEVSGPEEKEVEVQEVSGPVEKEEQKVEESVSEQENIENEQDVHQINSDNIDEIVIKDILSKLNNSQQDSANDTSIAKIPEETREQIARIIHNALYGEIEENKAQEEQKVEEVQETEVEKNTIEVQEIEIEENGEEIQEQEQDDEEIHEDNQEQEKDDPEDLGKILQNAIKWLNKELRYK